MNNNNIVTLTTTQDITDICQPLLNSTPINFFHYFRVHHDGGVCSLTNNAIWFKNWLDKKYYEISSFCSHPQTNTKKFMLTSSEKIPNTIVHDAHEGYQIGPGLVISSPSDNFYEFFLFCIDSNYKRSSADFFLNNLELLERFTVFFKDKSMDIIKLHSKNKIYFPDSSIMTDKSDSTESFINIIPQPTHYYINDDNYLTQREVECIVWLSKGKTPREISSHLNRSTKTIERHIENAKSKMAVSKAVSLVLKAKELKFI